MPHKHKRRADEDDESHFDLPPTSHAVSLAVGKSRTFNPAPRIKKRKLAHVDGYGADDTPKAFARLMAFTKSATKEGGGGGGKIRRRSGLDDGVVKSKKQARKEKQHAGSAGNTDVDKTETDNGNSVAQTHASTQTLKIHPNESLSAFRARVDAALPLSGIPRSSASGTKQPGLAGLDHRVTKHERRLKKLQAGWRAEEARIRDKEAEARELGEEEVEEHRVLWESVGGGALGAAAGGGREAKGKKGKNARRRLEGEVSASTHAKEDEDWAALQRSRAQRQGINDVVSAPPVFHKVPREVFKVRNGAGAQVKDVPGKAGSLRRREELGVERRGVVEAYREMVGKKRGRAGVLQKN